MISKKFLVGLMVLAFLVSGFAAPGEVSADEPEFVADVFLHAVESYQARDRVFKQYVESASDGRIQVNLHPREAIAPDEHDAVELVRMGEMTVTQNSEAAIAEAFDRDILAIGLPFLLDSPQVGERILHHRHWFFEEIANRIYEGSNQDVRLVGAHVNSFRHFYSTEPVRTPSDLADKGIDLRTLDNPLHMTMWGELGAGTVAVPTPDRFMALETGMVNAMEGGIASVEGIGGFEILDHVTLLGYIFSANFLTVNEDWYQELPEDLQRVVREGWHEAMWIESSNREWANYQALEKIVDEGMVESVIIPTEEEMQEWRDVAVPIGYDFLVEEEGVDPDFIELLEKAVEEVEEEIDSEVDRVESVLQ